MAKIEVTGDDDDDDNDVNKNQFVHLQLYQKVREQSLYQKTLAILRNSCTVQTDGSFCLNNAIGVRT